jgi:hypothetical protein
VISCEEPAVEPAAAGAAVGSVAIAVPASEGAAVAGVDAATGVVVVAVAGPTACGFVAADPPPSAIIVWTAYAIARASRHTSPIAIFFCFAALSFAASAGFFFLAMSSPLVPTRGRERRRTTAQGSWS